MLYIYIKLIIKCYFVINKIHSFASDLQLFFNHNLISKMKFKFFSVLTIALMMFIGVSLSAQNYVPNTEALPKVEQELVSLYQGVSDVKASVVNPTTGSTANQAEISKSLKIQYAKELINTLKKGTPTAKSLDATNSVLAKLSNDQRYKDSLQDADLYFKNLLK